MPKICDWVAAGGSKMIGKLFMTFLFFVIDWNGWITSRNGVWLSTRRI